MVTISGGSRTVTIWQPFDTDKGVVEIKKEKKKKKINEEKLEKVSLFLGVFVLVS